MDRGPGARENSGQATSYDIGGGTGPENDVSPRKDLWRKQKVGDAAHISGEGGALQMAKKGKEEQQYQHDGNGEVSSSKLPGDIFK